MSKGKRRKPGTGGVLLRGAAVSLAVYLAGVLLLALLVVKGIVPQEAAFPVIAALCVLGALSGGLTAARRTPWGPLPSALANTGLFVLALLAVGLGCWQERIGAPGGMLLLCALGGGTAAGLLGARQGRRRKRI